MKISKEVKTAILVILGIALFILGFNYLKGKSLFETTNTYYSIFDYNALTKASPVTVRGNNIGKIKDIVFDYKSGKTKVYFTVSDQLKFSKDSKVRMYETGLMGGNGLSIVLGGSQEIAKSGDLLESEVEPGLVTSLSKNFSGLSNNLDSTLKSTDTLMRSLNKLVIDDSAEGLKNTIAELNQTLKGYKELSYSINALLAKNDENITNMLKNFKSTSENLAQLSEDLKNANLDNTLITLNKAVGNMNGILSGMENGEGSMGKLMKDEALYNNLKGVSKEMEELIRDIKLHPKRYFRILSKKEIPYSEEPSK